jgi:hypothetical protein
MPAFAKATAGPPKLGSDFASGGGGPRRHKTKLI